MAVERQERFTLRTALGLAVLLHLLAWVFADRGWLGTIATAPDQPPSSPPLKFVFTEAPPREPPPEVMEVADGAHHASQPELATPDAAAEPPPPAAPPPAPAPRRPPRSRPPSPAPPPPAQARSEPAPEPALPADWSETAREREASPQLAGLFSAEAIAQVLEQQEQASPRPSAAPPEGVLDFDAKDFEFGPYARQIYIIIKRNWESVLRSQNIVAGVKGRTRISFRIQRRGDVAELQVLTPSGWGMLDRSAVASIELSEPLPALPEAFPRDDVGVTFTYYYNLPPEPGE